MGAAQVLRFGPQLPHGGSAQASAMLLWPVISIGGVRKFLESWMNGAGKMHPLVVAARSTGEGAAHLR